MNRMEHLLTIVAEEAVEVAQRATKALRFGLYEIQPGQPHTNGARMLQEVHDLLAALEMLHEEEALPFTIDTAAIAAKKAKVEKFLAYSRELGTLIDDVRVGGEAQQMVPVKPTAAMLEAGAMRVAMNMQFVGAAEAKAEQVWRDMLAAAPKDGVLVGGGGQGSDDA